MSVVIKSAAVAAATVGESAATVLLAGRAARDCLAQAGLSVDTVGVLINVGVYREHNTFEPAIGALVQKEIGMNLDYLDSPMFGAGFSMDLMNSGCGVLNAVQAAQALLQTGTTERVLVTAGDVHPSGHACLDLAYPFADLGAALLLERSSSPGVGFGAVNVSGSLGPAAGAGYLALDDVGAAGRSRIAVRQPPDYTERLVELATKSATEYACAHGLDLRRGLLIVSRPTEDFAARLAERLGLPAARVLAPDAPDGRGLPHTAAQILGYVQATREGLPPGTDQLMFVAAGAGPSVACASYRPQESM